MYNTTVLLPFNLHFETTIERLIEMFNGVWMSEQEISS